MTTGWAHTGCSHKRCLLAVCALTFMSCTRQTQTASLRGPIPAAPAVATRQVNHASDAGEGDIELRRLRQRLAANPKDLDARILLARYYAAQGLPDLALEHYRFAAAQFPDSAVAALALSKTLREAGEPGEALRTIAGYVERQPNASWEALSLEGILEDEQGKFAESEKAYRAALALAPDSSELHNNLGYSLLSQSRNDAAVIEFRRAIELDSKSEVAHNNLAAALASASNAAPGEALKEWQRSASPAEAHNNMAAVLMGRGKYAEARAELNLALGFQPNLAAALANLKLVAEMDGQPATMPVSRSADPARRVSLWARIFGGKPAPKAAVSGVEDGSPASPAGQPGAAPVETAVKK
jgi:Flp pilus assembly protein TadD